MRRGWDFQSPMGMYDWEYIKEGKRFFEDLDKEFKEKNKPNPNQGGKVKQVITNWLFLAAISPIIGMTYGLAMVWIAKELILMVKGLG